MINKDNILNKKLLKNIIPSYVAMINDIRLCNTWQCYKNWRQFSGITNEILLNLNPIKIITYYKWDEHGTF